MKNNIRTASARKDAPRTHEIETLCTAAIERLAQLLGIPVDLDDPEPVMVAAVERRVAELLNRTTVRLDGISAAVQGQRD